MEPQKKGKKVGFEDGTLFWVDATGDETSVKREREWDGHRRKSMFRIGEKGFKLANLFLPTVFGRFVFLGLVGECRDELALAAKDVPSSSALIGLSAHMKGRGKRGD